MATNIIGSLGVALSADAKGIQQAMEQTRKAVSAAGDALDQTASRVTAAGNKIDVNLSKTAGAFKKYTKASTDAGNAARRLVPQFNDVAVSIAGGMSPLQIAMQQGSQITQVFSEMGGGIAALKSVGSALMGMLNPVSLLTMGAIAAAGALAQKFLPSIMETVFGGKDLKKALEEAERAQANYNKAAKDAGIPLSDLRAKFGALGDEIYRTNQLIFENERLKLLASKKSNADAIFDTSAGEDYENLLNGGVFAIDPFKRAGRKTGLGGEDLDAYLSSLSRISAILKDNKATEEQIIGAFSAHVELTDRLENLESLNAEQRAKFNTENADALNQVKIFTEVLETRESNLNAVRDEFLGKTKELTTLEEKRKVILEQIGKTVGEDQNLWKLSLTEVEKKIQDIRAEMSGISATTKEMIENSNTFAQNIATTMNRMSGMMNGIESAITIGPDGRLVNNTIGSSGSDALAIARKFTGLSEGTNNAELRKLLPIDPATTAWCAAFVNAVLGRMGMQGTDSLAARSFLDYGSKVTEPQPGDIVILKRGSDPTKGHVGFYEGTNADGSINVFGGNQGNQVKSSRFSANSVLGYRRVGMATNDLSTVQDEIEIDRQTAAAEAAQKSAEESARKRKEADREAATAAKRKADEAQREADKQKEISEDLARRVGVQRTTDQAELLHKQQIAAIENNRALTDTQKEFQIARVNAEFERQKFIIAEIARLEDQGAATDVNIAKVKQIADQQYATAMSTAQMKASQDSYNQSLQFTTEIMGTLESGFADVFTSIVTGAKSAREALGQMLAQLAQMFASKAFQAIWNGAPGGGGGVGGWLQGIVSGILGGGRGDPLSAALSAIPGFANGGVASGLYMAGERGRELIASGPARVFNHQQTERMLAGANGSARVEVVLSPDLEARILGNANNNAVKITRTGISDYNNKLPRRIDQYSRDPRAK